MEGLQGTAAVGYKRCKVAAYIFSVLQLEAGAGAASLLEPDLVERCVGGGGWGSGDATRHGKALLTSGE